MHNIARRTRYIVPFRRPGRMTSTGRRSYTHVRESKQSWLIVAAHLARHALPDRYVRPAVTSVCQVRQTDSRLGGGEFFDWYCSDDARVYAALISGVLPPVLLTLWEVFVISFYMLYLVQKQNAHVSLSATDRRFLRFYWAWGAVNVLIGGIFGGAISLFTTTLNDTVSVNGVQLQLAASYP